MHNTRSPLVTWLRNLTTLGVLLACCGFVIVCPAQLVYRAGARPGFEFRLVDPADRRGPRDYYFRLESQRDDGRTIAIAPFFVYPGPFTFEGRSGISDLARVPASTGAISCFELFERYHFSDQAYTVDLCGRYTSGGYQVFNSENQDQRFYPGVYLLDFRIEYDGTTLSFSVRPAGAQTWDLVTSFPFSYEDPLIPSMGAIGLGKGGVYDVEELTWTTTPPLDWSAETGFGWHVQEAYRYDLAALEKLEGATPDFSGASVDLGTARTRLGLALDLTEDFVDAKIGKQTARYVIQADKRLEKAQRRAEDSNANGSVSDLLKSIRYQGIAFQRTFELDFREEF